MFYNPSVKRTLSFCVTYVSDLMPEEGPDMGNLALGALDKADLEVDWLMHER